MATSYADDGMDDRIAARELPFPIRAHKKPAHTILSDKERAKSELPMHPALRIIAISPTHVWAHCFFTEELKTVDTSMAQFTLYVYDIDEGVWICTNMFVRSKVATASICNNGKTLFLVSVDEEIHCASLESGMIRSLNCEIPPYATNACGTYYIKLTPVSPTECIYIAGTGVPLLFRFVRCAERKKACIPMDLPLEACLAIVPGPALGMVWMTEAGVWLTAAIPLPCLDEHAYDSLATDEKHMLCMPTPEQYPTIATGQEVLRWVNMLYFESPSIGRCIALMSPTTILIHSADAPFGITSPPVHVICRVNEPTDMTFRPETDTLCVVNYIGEVFQIKCNPAEPVGDINNTLRLPSASLQCALNYLPGSIFAFNQKHKKWVLFPMNTRLVNILPEDGVLPTAEEEPAPMLVEEEKEPHEPTGQSPRIRRRLDG